MLARTDTVYRQCKRCPNTFKPKREAQTYCSRHCRVADAVARHRQGTAERSDYIEPPLPPVLRSDYTAPAAPTAPPESPLNADELGPELWEYQSGLFDPVEIEFDADGHPKLPACLRRTA
jgi:hypothetical protein